MYGVGASSSRDAGNEEPERVVRASFGVIEGPHPRRVLLLCYAAAGWQAWDLEHSGGSREPHELCSLRDAPVTEVLVLSLPEASASVKHTVTADQYPLFAVCGPDTTSAAVQTQTQAYVVRLYSLPQADYVRTLPFTSPVLAMRAAPRVLAVMTRTHVLCLDAGTLDVLFSAHVLPPTDAPPQLGDILPFGALALTSRWVAFAAAEPPPPMSAVQRTASAPRGGNAAHVAAHFVKVGGSALLKMGDAGIKTVTAMLSPRHSSVTGTQAHNVQTTLQPLPTEAAAMDNSHASATGTVLVRDLVSRTTVAHFRAHGSPLCSLAASGDLLMTASVHGTCAHVYAIRGGAVHQLYRLQRGWSQAIVQHMAFSRDATWAAVCTAKGTTHVFAICAGGGPVSADTHAVCPTAAPCVDVALAAGSPSSISTPVAGQPSSMCAPTETLHAVARVRAAGDGWLGAVTHRVGQAGALVGVPTETGAMAATLRTLADADTGGEAQRELLVVMPAGSMTRYLLRTRAVDSTSVSVPGLQALSEVPPEHRAEAKALGVTLVPLERWDVRRCPSWPERFGAATTPAHESAPLPPPPTYEEVVQSPALCPMAPLSPPSAVGRSAMSLPADDATQVVDSASPDMHLHGTGQVVTAVAASVYGADALAFGTSNADLDLDEADGDGT